MPSSCVPPCRGGIDDEEEKQLAPLPPKIVGWRVLSYRGPELLPNFWFTLLIGVGGRNRWKLLLPQQHWCYRQGLPTAAAPLVFLA